MLEEVERPINNRLIFFFEFIFLKRLFIEVLAKIVFVTMVTDDLGLDSQIISGLIRHTDS